MSINASTGFTYTQDVAFTEPDRDGNGQWRVYWDGYNSMASAGVVPNNQWEHMEIKMDLSTLSYQLFNNGTQMGGTWQYQYAPTSGNAINRIIFGGTFDGGQLYIDNVTATVSQVPEPVTGGLMLLSGGLFLLKREKKTRV